jgi:hypothetical protein
MLLPPHCKKLSSPEIGVRTFDAVSYCMCPVTHEGVHDWKLEYQERLEGRFIGMCSIHWMKKPEEYQYGSKMGAAHKQDWYFHCNGVSRNIVLVF